MLNVKKVEYFHLKSESDQKWQCCNSLNMSFFFFNTYEDKFLSLLMQISNFFINYEINSYSVFFYSKSIEIKIESQYGK